MVMRGVAKVLVIAGLVPAISIGRAQCPVNRDARDNPRIKSGDGHDHPPSLPFPVSRKSREGEASCVQR